MKRAMALVKQLFGLILMVAVVALVIPSTGCKRPEVSFTSPEGEKHVIIEGTQPTPVLKVPGMEVGDWVILIYWNNAGKAQPINATVGKDCVILPNAKEFAALPKELNPEFHSEPGLRTMKSQELYWLGSTTIMGNGGIRYNPSQIEVVTEMSGWRTAGTALRDHYLAKLNAQAKPAAAENPTWPKVVSLHDVVKHLNMGFTEFDDERAVWVTVIGRAQECLGPVIAWTMKTWGTRDLRIISKTKTYEGKEYIEFTIIPLEENVELAR